MSAERLTDLSYVTVAPSGRYFVTEEGAPFLVIGFNEALPWPQLRRIRDRDGLPAVDAYLRGLVSDGVTVLRVMLEYCSDEEWFFEDERGVPRPEAIRCWDDLIALCERNGLRLLVLFWDTFHMYQNWQKHPYSRCRGLDCLDEFLTSAACIEAQKRRIRFFVERWGHSPAIFAYDLFNEINPVWGGSPEQQAEWVTEMATFTRRLERDLWGRSHLVTVSLFGATPGGAHARRILAHPDLDFITTHTYDFGTVDNPSNYIDAACAMRNAVLCAHSIMSKNCPYVDTEHGPIHMFLDLGQQLPEEIDDEYFHNMTWAHLASGGAGSGMRWPYRDPHCLTPGMRSTLRALARIAQTVDWTRFHSRPADHEIQIARSLLCGAEPLSSRQYIAFACADDAQWLVWLVSDARSGADAATAAPLRLLFSNLHPGLWDASTWDTKSGALMSRQQLSAAGPAELPLPSFGRDLAVTLARR